MRVRPQTNICMYSSLTESQQIWLKVVTYISAMDAMIPLAVENVIGLNSASTIDSWTQYGVSILLFFAKCFLFEIVFDFFHYWGHRFCHEVSPGNNPPVLVDLTRGFMLFSLF